MPSASRLLRAARHDGLSRGARAGLLRLELARRLRPRARYALRLGTNTVYLSHDDFEIDWKSLAFVVVDEAYAGSYAGAVVVDIGAHKGYFAAYAFERGARAVVSYEPEAANFSLLRLAAQERGEDWIVEQAAVGATAGEAELHVMNASWGHALHPPDAFSEYEVGTQRVNVVALGDVLERAHVLAAGASVVVKVNIEGEECRVILGTPPSAWEVVEETHIETHPWASCAAGEIADHVAPAGLSRRASAHPNVLRLRRGGSPPAGPSTAPR